jgi:hypothetical protein
LLCGLSELVRHSYRAKCHAPPSTHARAIHDTTAVVRVRGRRRLISGIACSTARLLAKLCGKSTANNNHSRCSVLCIRMEIAAATMASAHMDPEASQRIRYPLENPATCAEGIPDADATSGRRGNAHRRPADDYDTAASVTTQPTTRTTIIAVDHTPQVPWTVSSSRTMLLGPHNTEFSGEPAALPSLVRCNSSFGGTLLSTHNPAIVSLGISVKQFLTSVLDGTLDVIACSRNRHSRISDRQRASDKPRNPRHVDSQAPDCDQTMISSPFGVRDVGVDVRTLQHQDAFREIILGTVQPEECLGRTARCSYGSHGGLLADLATCKNDQEQPNATAYHYVGHRCCVR